MAERPVELNPTSGGPAQLIRLAEAVIRDAGDAIMVLDLTGAVIVWNKGCEGLFGWSAAEMVGRTFEALLPSDRRDELGRVLCGLAGRPESAALETLRLHKSGTVAAVSCRVSPVLDGHAVVGASVILRENARHEELRRQMEEARSLAESRFAQSVIAQATLAPDATIIDVNPALCRLSGYDCEQLVGRSALDFMREDELQAAAAGLNLLRLGSLSKSEHHRLLKRADGDFVETRVSIFSVRDSSGAVRRLEAVIEDVSATAAALRELQVREARWQSLGTHSADVAQFCDPDGRLLFVSGSVKPRFGYEPEDLLGADGFAFIHPEDEPGVRAIWAATAAGPRGTTTTFETRLRHADGSWRWVEQSLTNSLEDPAIAAMIVNITDISERKAAEAVLDELAGSDQLTGLATRAPLMAALDAAFTAGEAASTAVAIVDITRLKLVNDKHGHRAGDSVLTELAARLMEIVDARGIVARIGGDRFAVMLRDVTDTTEVLAFSAELLEAFAVPFSVGETSLTQTSLTLSGTVGAAMGPAVDGGSLLSSAESALATAKEGLSGQTRVVRAESASAAVRHARLIEDLRRGLDNDELVVQFQPIVTVPDGRTVAAEALVRWQHPHKGLLSPGAFIAAAEDSGLIVEVGRRVLSAACSAAARWATASGGQHPFHVAVNLSAKQLTGGGVVDVVRDALRAHGAAARSLVLEVTESAVMADVDAAVRTLQELRDLGVGIAVDDFGTGYSSLTYLKQFPVTTLKIDRSFVSGLGQNSDDAAIVSSVVSLARALRLSCVAEGVETEQQRLILQALGCSYGQGFLWSPAMDRAAFDLWLGDALVSDPSSAAHGGAFPTSTGVPTSGSASSAPRAGSAKVWARVDALAAGGASLHTIAAALNAENLLTAQGKRWTSRSVGFLLAARRGG